MYAQVGDKVRLKSDDRAVRRGIVERIAENELVIRIEDSQKLVSVPTHSVVNFSLAARKAWKSMPDRRVGRPKGTRLCDRVSVTLRIDRDLWESFRLSEQRGVIKDRTATINGWLREKLQVVLQAERES